MIITEKKYNYHGPNASDFCFLFAGTMPGPMIFGTAFDAACLLTQNICEGDEGSCYSYDHDYLGYYMLTTAGLIKLLSCVFMFLAWRLYKPPKNEKGDYDADNTEMIVKVADSSNINNKVVNDGISSQQNGDLKHVQNGKFLENQNDNLGFDSDEDFHTTAL